LQCIWCLCNVYGVLTMYMVSLQKPQSFQMGGCFLFSTMVMNLG